MQGIRMASCKFAREQRPFLPCEKSELLVERELLHPLLLSRLFEAPIIDPPSTCPDSGYTLTFKAWHRN
jgi:hypothetical protein